MHIKSMTTEILEVHKKLLNHSFDLKAWP